MINVLCVCVTLLIIMGFALLFHSCFKVTPEEAWAFAIMSILLFIFITGIAGNTIIALILVYCLAAVGFFLGITAAFRKSECSIVSFFSPGIVMIWIVTGIGVVAFEGMLVYNWDELYQWGKAANFMVEFDKLPNGSAFSGESLLLSSTTFFHYFIAKISYFVQERIIESNYYVSNLVLWFSALILPISGEGWKNWKRVFGFGLVLFLLQAVLFVQPYYNIYTDQPTAYWAGGVIAWLVLGKYNRRNVYLIPLALLNIGLMKSMVGPMFAVIVLVAAVVVDYMKRREKKGDVERHWKKVFFSKKGLFGMAVVFSPVVLVGVWSLITGSNGLFRFNGISQEPGQEDRAARTLKSMIGWVFDSVNLREEHLYLSYGVFILLTVGLVYIIYPVIMDKKMQKSYKSLMNFYIAGFVGYFLVMFIAYMTVFGYVDSVRAMSLNRYYSDYMMLGIVPLLLPLFLKSGTEDRRMILFMKKGIIFFVFVTSIYSSSDYLLQNLAHPYAMDTKNYAERERMADYAKEVKSLTNERGKIYFINQKETGLFTLVADYEMGDQLSRTGMCFNFREDTSEPVLGLTDYPIESLPAVLLEQDYQYVWVYSTNNYFNESMKELFGLKKVKNGNFYQVVIEEGEISLEYVGKIK